MGLSMRVAILLLWFALGSNAYSAAPELTYYWSAPVSHPVYEEIALEVDKIGRAGVKEIGKDNAVQCAVNKWAEADALRSETIKMFASKVEPLKLSPAGDSASDFASASSARAPEAGSRPRTRSRSNGRAGEPEKATQSVLAPRLPDTAAALPAPSGQSSPSRPTWQYWSRETKRKPWPEATYFECFMGTLSVLDEAEALASAALAHTLERMLDYHQDIEWSMAKSWGVMPDIGRTELRAFTVTPGGRTKKIEKIIQGQLDHWSESVSWGFLFRNGKGVQELFQHTFQNLRKFVFIGSQLGSGEKPDAKTLKVGTLAQPFPARRPHRVICINERHMAKLAKFFTGIPEPDFSLWLPAPTGKVCPDE
jgi:hypothetical protein